MRKNRIKTAIVVIACGLALVGCSDAGSGSPGSEASTSASAETAGFNGADVMFVQMMNPHHQQAIEMSDLLLAKDGVDPQVTDLAQQIKDAQGPEIEQMAGWAKTWGVSATPAPGHDHGGGDMGMLDQEAMTQLKDADGKQATKLYLTGMIEHHEGAIAMAEDEVEKGEHPDALQLATDIISTQQTEIDTMNALLAEL